MHKRKEHSSQHWASFSQRWEQLGSPLRPCAEDQAGYQSFIDPWLGNFSRTRILILGVTPEIFRLRWPRSHELCALDRSREMIEAVWPGPPKCVIEGDWLQMPFGDGSQEITLCDGGPILLAYPEAQRALRDQLHRVVVPGGRAIFRLFARPPERESVEQVLSALQNQRLGNLNILKLRLGAALQRQTEEGVAVQDILRAIESVDADLPRLAHRLGWTWDHMRVIEAYRESRARYVFPSEEEFTRLFCRDGRFTPLGRWQGTYPLAERCPILAYERQRSPP